MDIIKGSIRSFYSKSFYNDLARVGRGIGVGYIFIRTLIAVVATLVMLSVVAPGFVDRVATVFANLPIMTYSKEGKVSIDAHVPYNIPFGDPNNPIFITIDPSYKINNPDATLSYMQEHSIIAMLTADKLVALKSRDEIDIHDLRASLHEPFVVTHDDWKDIAQKIRDRAIPLITISLILIITIVNFIETFVTGLVLMVAGLITRASLTLDQGMRVSAAFRIPVLVIGWGLEGLNVPHAGGIAWVVWLAYLVFAIVAVKPASQTAA